LFFTFKFYAINFIEKTIKP